MLPYSLLKNRPTPYYTDRLFPLAHDTGLVRIRICNENHAQERIAAVEAVILIVKIGILIEDKANVRIIRAPDINYCPFNGKDTKYW